MSLSQRTLKRSLAIRIQVGNGRLMPDALAAGTWPTQPLAIA